jgi:hypothetical protein
MRNKKKGKLINWKKKNMNKTVRTRRAGKTRTGGEKTGK